MKSKSSWCERVPINLIKLLHKHAAQLFSTPSSETLCNYMHRMHTACILYENWTIYEKCSSHIHHPARPDSGLVLACALTLPEMTEPSGDLYIIKLSNWTAAAELRHKLDVLRIVCSDIINDCINVNEKKTEHMAHLCKNGPATKDRKFHTSVKVLFFKKSSKCAWKSLKVPLSSTIQAHFSWDHVEKVTKRPTGKRVTTWRGQTDHPCTIIILYPIIRFYKIIIQNK